MNLDKEDTYTSLKDLQSISIVKASIQHPLEFIAIPFKEVIDLFIEVKKDQAKTMKKNKEELLSNWLTIIKKNT